LEKRIALLISLIVIVTAIISIIYLQSIAGESKNPAPTQSPVNTPTSMQATTAPTPVIVIVPPENASTTTTTYDGTTLVCTWTSSKTDGFILVTNGSSSFININYLNTTNIGAKTAFVFGYKVQGYFQNGSSALNTTIYVDAAGIYSVSHTPNWEPFIILPGQSLSGNPFNLRATEQGINKVGTADNDFWKEYSITPVWSTQESSG
jgi:hypothetical protein